MVIVFLGMHVVLVEASDTDGWTDDRKNNPYVVLCFAGTTKTTADNRKIDKQDKTIFSINTGA